MEKFVKVSYVQIALGLGRLMVAGLRAGGASFLMKNLSKINWGKTLPALLNTNAALKQSFLAQFPRYAAGFVGNIKALVEDFFTALADPAFQTLAASAILEFIGAGLMKEDMYSQEAIQHYYETKDLYGQPIAAGGYQKTMGKVPPKNAIPNITPEEVNNRIAAIGMNNKLTDQEKLQELNNLIKELNNKIKPMENFIGLK